MSKVWKSYDDQVNILRSRGMTIDLGEDQTKQFLQRLGYYRLSGYWYPMREIASRDSNNQPIRGDRFVEGTTFSLVVDLFIFDKSLRLLAVDAIERVELSVQVDISHLLGKVDPRAHEISTYFHGNFTKKPGKDGKTGHARWLENYAKSVDRNKRKTFVAHNIDKYGYLPIWAAAEIWDFGMLSILFSGMKKVDQDEIARKYGLTDGKFLAQWLRSLNLIRNLSAHHSRLWNANIVEVSSVPNTFSKLRNLNNKRPFLYFGILSHMLNVISPDSSWSRRYKELLQKFPDSNISSISLAAHGVDSKNNFLGL